MKQALRLLLVLFTILSSTTIANATVQDTQTEVVFGKACVLKVGIGFSTEFFAPNNATITPSTLHTRGVKPAAGTRVRPEGIPADWKVRPTNSGGGVQYYNPRNPNQNVRVMQGNPNSPYPNSQAPYARQQNAGGTYLRQDGTPSPLPRGGLRDPDAHIPLNQFQVR